MRKSNKLIFLILICLSFILISACSGSSTETEPASKTETETRTEEQNNPSGPQYGGVLKLAYGRDAVAIGLASEMITNEDLNFARPALEWLGRLDENGVVQPFLAKGWEQDPDNATITIYLRPGIKFHDGTDFNAEAVKWNIETFQASGRSELERIQSVEVVDDTTVVLHLDKWDNSTLDAVCIFVPMSSPTAYEKHGKDWAAVNPVGTGPFIFESWERDVVLKYKKNENYWQEGKPYLDGIEFHIIKDEMTALASFKRKEIDAYLNISISAVKELENTDAQILTNSAGRIFGIIGNSKDPDSPFADVRVRKAIAHAIDVESIIQGIMGGYVLRTNQWGPPGAWSFNPNVEIIPYDPEKSKELLAEAGYPNGIKTTLGINPEGDDDQQVYTVVQDYLANVGIDATLEVLDRGRFTQLTGDQATWDGLMQYRGRSDPDLGMYMSRVVSNNGRLFFRGIDVPDEIDPMYEQLRSAKDDNTKQNIAHELQRLIFDEYHLFTPFYIKTWLGAAHPEVQDGGWEFHASYFTPENAWLKQ